MAHHLKTAKGAEERAAADSKVRATVEAILADIEKRGDAAVRELSQKFDDWSPEHFRLTPAEIEAAMARVSARDLADIRSAIVAARTAGADEIPVLGTETTGARRAMGARNCDREGPARRLALGRTRPRPRAPAGAKRRAAAVCRNRLA
jgi:histidinol dehydrogenase